ncbi:MAG TPA: SRPBCC domain-containing protein [Anaerolineales bacterium]|nr:SRPBCC domain-containing protein [Anaerolineales bacterium]
MSTKTLTYTQEVAAPISQLYRAFTSAQGLQEWFGDVVEADPREGGRVYVWWNEGYYTAGQFVHLEENHKVAFSWHGLGEPAPTRVRVLLEENGEGTKVTLFHDDVPESGAEAFDKEWPSALANLKSVLEKGVDKRQYDRPMLGFFVGGLVDENLQKRLNLPVDYGVHVSGVLDGMGAQKSGLQADDIIAVIESTEIRRFPDIGLVLGKHKGGDVVNTVVYRNGEKLDMKVELSKRPIPDFPPAPEQLAEIGLAAYKEELTALKEAFADYTEEEASHNPGPGEWSAKEVVAHLLVGERWSHAAWDLLANGNKGPAYPGSNLLVQAIAKTYDVESLLKELKYSIKLNMNLIRALPEKYYTNKASYFAAASNFEQGIRTHFQQHTAQIKTALTTAREALSESEPVPA